MNIDGQIWCSEQLSKGLHIPLMCSFAHKYQANKYPYNHFSVPIWIQAHKKNYQMHFEQQAVAYLDEKCLH